MPPECTCGTLSPTTAGACQHLPPCPLADPVERLREVAWQEFIGPLPKGSPAMPAVQAAFDAGFNAAMLAAAKAILQQREET